jgi:hypothetical protein
MQLSNFLRTVLKLDAASCLGMAAMVLPFAAGLQAPLGIDARILQGAAASLIPIGLFILWLGSRREAPAALVMLVIVGNLGWTTASLGVAASLAGITPIGQAAMTVQGLAVLALALAEWAGLRSSQKTTVQKA